MLGPVSNEGQSAGSGTGFVRGLSQGVSPACMPVLVHMYVVVWWHCLGCGGTWVIPGASTPAPGRVGAFAGGSRGC